MNAVHVILWSGLFAACGAGAHEGAGEDGREVAGEHEDADAAEDVGAGDESGADASQDSGSGEDAGQDVGSDVGADLDVGGEDVADAAEDGGAEEGTEVAAGDSAGAEVDAEGPIESPSCATLVAPEPDVGVPPSTTVCADPGPCDPQEHFAPYLADSFDGSGEPGVVGDGFLVGADDRYIYPYAGGPALGAPEATIEAGFKVGTSSGCLIATDWRGYLAFSTAELIALGYGADPNQLVEARFPLNAFPPRAWEAYADGGWHHVAVTIDTASGLARFFLDGVTSPEIETHAAPIDGLVAASIVAIGVGCTGWGLDEVAIYERALPAALIAEHAAAIARHEPYPDHSACGAIPCAPTSYDSRYVAEEFAPVGEDGRPTMNALEQLETYPLPRYREGHRLHRLESWVQALWLSADNDLKLDANYAGSRAVKLMQELAWRWHYYYDLSHLGCLGLDYPDCAEAARGFLEAHPEVETVWQTYAAGAGVDLTAERPACPLGLNPLWSGGAFYEASLAWNDYWVELSQDILGRPIDVIVEDGETWWEGRQWGGPPLAESDLATCAETDPEVMEVYARDYVANGLDARQMWTDAFTRWRLAWNDGLRELNRDATTPILWYGMDGYPAWNAGDWGLGARLAEASTEPQTFGGEPQRYSGLDFYPAYWGFDISVGPRHGIDWVGSARAGEVAAGDYLAWPFVAAGWSTEPQVIRPGMWLGILKLLAAWGAESYHAGYFAYPPHSPGGEWVWQAAIPAYAQAVTSRWERLLRSSVLVQAGQRGNPRHVVLVRQELDATGAPVARWLVTGNVNRWENTADTLYAKDAVVDVQLGDEVVRVPIRMQGSVYVYDATGAEPTLVQLDAWHEWMHPAWWSEDFAFEAEDDDGVSGEAPIRTAWPAAETGVRDGAHATTARMMEAGASVRFAFEPRRAGAFVTWLALTGDGPAELVVTIGEEARHVVVGGGHADTVWLRAEGEAVALAAGPAVVTVAVRAGAVRLDKVRLVRDGGPTHCGP